MKKIFQVFMVMSLGVQGFSQGALSSDPEADARGAIDHAKKTLEEKRKEMRKTCRVEMQNELKSRYRDSWKNQGLVLDRVEMKATNPLFLSFYLKNKETGKELKSLDVTTGYEIGNSGHFSIHGLPYFIPAARDNRDVNQILVERKGTLEAVDAYGDPMIPNNFLLGRLGYKPTILISSHFTSSEERSLLLRTKGESKIEPGKDPGEDVEFERSGLSVDIVAYRACLVRELSKFQPDSSGGHARDALQGPPKRLYVPAAETFLPPKDGSVVVVP